MNDLKLLVLAGGQSSRMGTPKHLLELNSEPNYVRLLKEAQLASPGIQSFMSLPKRDCEDRTNERDDTTETNTVLRYIFDQHENIGPAAGLLAAFETDPFCSWLVIACDYPLLSSDEIKRLIDNYEPPVTCFNNREGYHEPLIAIWNPTALRKLQQQVELGMHGPNRVIKIIGGKGIEPFCYDSLINTNTPQEWEAVRSGVYKR